MDIKRMKMNNLYSFLRVAGILLVVVFLTTICGKYNSNDTFYSIEMVSGNNQTGSLGQPLADPIIVLVNDKNGNPCSGAKVFFVANDGGSVSENSVLTGSDGLASVIWTLGVSGDVQSVTVNASKSDNSTPLLGSPVVFYAAAAGMGTPCPGMPNVTYAGKIYVTVQIGKQCWIRENLAYLPSITPAADGSYTAPYYYVLGYDGYSVSEAKKLVNYNTYGVLYNWEAAKISCPNGWHLPSEAEWVELEKFLGASAGGKMKETGTNHWLSPNKGAVNTSGFTGLPASSRYYTGAFGDLGKDGYFWSSTGVSVSFAKSRWLNYDGDGIYQYENDRGTALSVRCILD
jgi:uncharacterized protein (TIGR02145 family)